MSRTCVVTGLLGAVATLCAAAIVVAMTAHATDDPVLHLRLATTLVPPVGRPLGGGSEEVWVDWHSGDAFSVSIVPGETTSNERWYRRVHGRMEIESLQVDGRQVSDDGGAVWDNLVLVNAEGGLSGLRARYASLVRTTAAHPPLPPGAHVVRITTAVDVLPAPLPGAMMQRGTTVWLDTRTHLPLTVTRSLLPYIGGSAETEICRVVALEQVPSRDVPPDFGGPAQPTLWDRVTTAMRAIVHRG